MTTELRVAAGVALILGVAGVGVMAQDSQEPGSRAEVPEDLVVETLGTSLAATDVWSVQCGAGTARVHADVDDNGGVDGIRLNVVVVNPQGRATGRTAPDNGVSAQAILAGGPGNYLVVITKSGGATAEAYDSSIHCRNSIGVHTLTRLLLVQDQ
jgi:hypothetical protein